MVSPRHRGARVHQPLSRILIQNTVSALHDSTYVKVSPLVLGLKRQTSEWVTVDYYHPNPSDSDWIVVFSPSNFSSEICEPEVASQYPPFLCTAPIKYEFANFKSKNYHKTGKGLLKLQIINQRADFSFALFSGNFSAPKLIAVSNKVEFAYPKAPVYPRLSQGKSWNEMTVTWTSGYGINEAIPFVEWGMHGEAQIRSPAGTLTFTKNSLCGSPARTVGWRDPGFIHTSFLKELWPNSFYTYRIGHKLIDGTYMWSKQYKFKASPYPGQDSLQRVVIFGDMGKGEAEGSNEFNQFQLGSLNTTNQLWDQFAAQIEPIASTIPYMIGSENHERDWPDSGSFYKNVDSSGECGVLAQTMSYVPAENRAKFWAIAREARGDFKRGGSLPLFKYFYISGDIRLTLKGLACLMQGEKEIDVLRAYSSKERRNAQAIMIRVLQPFRRTHTVLRSPSTARPLLKTS